MDPCKVPGRTAWLMVAAVVGFLYSCVLAESGERDASSSVRISEIQGYVVDGVPTVEWRISETWNVVGFFLTRSDDIAGSRAETVNTELLLVLPENWMTRSFSIKDRAADPSSAYYYTVTVVDAGGKKHSHGPFRLKFGVRPPAPEPRTVQVDRLPEQTADVEEGDRVKILIRRDDIYMMSASNIAECLTDLSVPDVVSAISNSAVRVFSKRFHLQSQFSRHQEIITVQILDECSPCRPPARLARGTGASIVLMDGLDLLVLRSQCVYSLGRLIR